MRIKLFAFSMMSVLASGIQAAPELNDLTNQKEFTTDSQLQSVQKELATAEKNLNTKKIQQQRNKHLINQTQIALEKARKELAELNQQQKISWQKLQKLQQNLARLQTEITGTKAQVARLLINNYKNQQASAVVLFLQNSDATKKSRLLQYSKYINSANNKVLKQLAEQQVQIAQQEQEINTEIAKLKKLEASARAKITALGKSHQVAINENKKLNAEISQHTNQIASLRDNERRLNAILVQIAQQRAAKKRAEAAAKAQAAKQRNQDSTQTSKKRTATATKKGNLTAEDLAIRGEEMPNLRGFSRLQGTLRKPVSGSVIGRFGQSRESGGVWHGILIATRPTGVQTIAAGEVAYIANLHGYGTTIVIDHGDGYMSVYSGLSSVNVSSGSRVSARQTIGTSGTLPAGEQGLYFEIRYRSRAINPLSWVR